MHIKPSNYRIRRHREDIKKLYGMKVCPTNGATSVGTITDVGPVSKTYWGNEVQTVTVLWATGKKKGKTLKQKAENLANFDAYFEEVKAFYTELEEFNKAAMNLGM